jgi:hypothetical protein
MKLSSTVPASQMTTVSSTLVTAWRTDARIVAGSAARITNVR